MEEQNSVQSPQQTTASIVVPIEKKSPVLVILLVLILLVSIGASGFLFYQNMQLQKKIDGMKVAAVVPLPEASVSPSPVVMVDPTNGWKTYTNSDYKFSFMYPSGYGNDGTVQSPYTGIYKNVIAVSDPASIQQATDVPFDGFNVYVVSDMKATDFSQYMANEVTALQNSPYGLDSVKGNGKQAVTVNGTSGYFIDVNSFLRLYYLPTSDGNNVVVFSRSMGSTSFSTTFDQILNSFKFTQ